MDFIRPPYETIADAQRKRQEAFEKKLAEKDARIKELEAQLAARDGK